MLRCRLLSDFPAGVLDCVPMEGKTHTRSWRRTNLQPAASFTMWDDEELSVAQKPRIAVVFSLVTSLSPLPPFGSVSHIPGMLECSDDTCPEECRPQSLKGSCVFYCSCTSRHLAQNVVKTRRGFGFFSIIFTRRAATALYDPSPGSIAPLV